MVAFFMRPELTSSESFTMIVMTSVEGQRRIFSFLRILPVIVKLFGEVSSGTHKKGDHVNLEVVTDVIVQAKPLSKQELRWRDRSSLRPSDLCWNWRPDRNQRTEYKAINETIVPLQFKKETHGGSSLVSIVLRCMLLLLCIHPGQECQS